MDLDTEGPSNDGGAKAPPAADPTAPKGGKNKRRPPSANAGGADGPQLSLLLDALRAARRGDFSVRLKLGNGHGEGNGNGVVPAVMRHIAEEFNAVVALNHALASETVRVERVVGREGRMTERASLGDAKGGWATSIGSINALIGDLVQPTTEVARVISAVAEGDFTQ